MLTSAWLQVVLAARTRPALVHRALFKMPRNVDFLDGRFEENLVVHGRLARFSLQSHEGPVAPRIVGRL